MNQERQKVFVEDAVIRMRDLRDQQDCFSKEEFKGLLLARFSDIAGAGHLEECDDLRKLVMFTTPVGLTLVGVGVFGWLQDGFVRGFLANSGLVGALLLFQLGLLLMGKTPNHRTECGIARATRLATVDALTAEGLITEKQDKALRSLIDEADKPERFEWREKSA